jgi:hypothetical protein
VVAVVRDLITASRLEEMAIRAGWTFTRVDGPEQLRASSDVDLVLVDWGARTPSWGPAIHAWRGAGSAGVTPTVLLFGPHTDLEAHASARAADLGPMRARSALFAALPGLLSE